ncbi:EmrB/QacA subfamily drug resistance transporter [Kibdelosporangium banguiense]|uniref:EmrB/QacA subfamily drug resistance transporter n=1 Tax=Kibdelosporangium banguiense TaxID=1365924 RepID=A0ABS4TYA7_9PSEU|nr:MFS transporter [Kibdelosporangium banguiense]MBP2329374.1 EmrB/QacA subfamily drug resistance transporter [Kibdelosporangium banguiense]
MQTDTTLHHEPTPLVPRRAKPALVFSVLALAGLVFAMLQSLVAPALPVIAGELNVSTAEISWLVTAYLLTAAVATPIAGRLGDMFGRRRILLIVLGVLATGALVAALAGNLAVLVIGRVLQGAGGAVLPLAFGIVRDELPANRVGVAVGLLSALLGAGGGLGAVLAGPIVTTLDWHWLFWIPLIMIVLAGVGIALGVPESPVRARSRVDVPGALLLSIGLVCLLLALSKGSSWGWASGLTLGLFGGAAVALTAWVVVELRVRAPLVDMRMLTSRGVWTTLITGTAFGVASFGSFLLTPLLLQLPTTTGYGLGRTVSEAGLFLLPATVAMVVFAPLSGALDRRFGAKLPLVIGTVMATASFVLLAVAHHAAWQVLTGVTLMGIGLGLASAAMTNAILATVPPSQTSVATSMNTLARTIGGSIGTAVLAAVLAATTTHHVPAEAGFTYGFWICAGVLTIAILAALTLPTGRRHPKEH